MGRGSSREWGTERLTGGLSGADAAEAALERVAKALARVFWKRCGLGVAEDLNRLLGGVDYDAAILAICEVLFDGGPQR